LTRFNALCFNFGVACETVSVMSCLSRNNIDSSDASMMPLEKITNEIPQNQVRAPGTAVDHSARKNVRIGMPYDVQRASSIHCLTADLCPTEVATVLGFALDNQIEIRDNTVTYNRLTKALATRTNNLNDGLHPLSALRRAAFVAFRDFAIYSPFLVGFCRLFRSKPDGLALKRVRRNNSALHEGCCAPPSSDSR